VELRIFDNASTDGTTAWLEAIASQSGVAVVTQPLNIGLEGNIASALLFSPGEYVWLLSDHMDVDTDSVRRLIRTLPILRSQGVFLTYAQIRSYGPVLRDAYAPRRWSSLSPSQQSHLIFNTGNTSGLIVIHSLRVAAARFIYRFAGYSYPQLGIYVAIQRDTLISETEVLSDFSRSAAASDRQPSYNSFRSRFIGYPEAIAALRRLNQEMSPNRAGLSKALGALRIDSQKLLCTDGPIDSADLWQTLLAFPWRIKPFLLACYLMSLLPSRVRGALARAIFSVSRDCVREKPDRLSSLSLRD
jgi:glycosyltransferase involved in cell wall biosynthesis